MIKTAEIYVAPFILRVYGNNFNLDFNDFDHKFLFSKGLWDFESPQINSMWFTLVLHSIKTVNFQCDFEEFYFFVQESGEIFRVKSWLVETFFAEFGEQFELKESPIPIKGLNAQRHRINACNQLQFRLETLQVVLHMSLGLVYKLCHEKIFSIFNFFDFETWK